MSPLSNFSAARSAELDGPDWLRARRAAAIDELDRRELPTFEDEEWRYSPIDDLDLDAYVPSTGVPATGGSGSADLEVLTGLGDTSGVVVTRDGAVVRAEVDAALASKGVRLGGASGLDAAADIVGATMAEPTDYFANLNDAFTVDPVVLDVPAGVVVDRPVVVVNVVDSDGVAVFSRLVVRLGADAEASVLELNRSADVASLFVPVTELDVAASARLDYAQIQDLGPRMWQIGNQVSAVGQQGRLKSWVGSFGGLYARARTDCRLVGRGASGDLLAAYFGDGDQTLDFRTFQDHIGADTTSNLLFKGVVDDASRSVYTGLIRVRPDARGTNALQTNRTVKLGEHAWAESVPNLEIENNDVRCAHASAVGPVDEDQRFYLESRGVPADTAERLLITGFFEEVVGALSVPAAADLVRRRVRDELDREEQA